MTVKFTAPKGVPDYLPPRSEAFLATRDALVTPLRRAGYRYVETAVFEDTALFERGVGESTDVVSKEMYTFTDKGGRSLTLRPEATAGIVRAVVEHGADRGQLPLKLWYAGPYFRYERPQAGRFRQLQQVDAEAIGTDDPAVDAELISLAVAGYAGAGLSGVRLQLNSLGDAVCRPRYRAALTEFLAALDLDTETRARAAVNPLRVLDDKRAEVGAQLSDAPVISDHLCAACREHYDAVRSYLRDLGVEWTDAPRLVRGLDYYTRTTFEFVHDGLGAQSSVGGGGRYDGLSEAIGGPALPAIGFGLGVDRTLLALESESPSATANTPVACDVFIVPLGDDAKRRALALAFELRRAGVAADLAFGDRGLKGAMKAADRAGARYAVVVGERDLESGSVQIKEMSSGEQQQVALSDVAEHVAGHLR